MWRWVAILALSVALTILSGFPAATFVVFGGAALMIPGLCLWPRPKWKVAGSIVIGFAVGLVIAAIQVIPTYQLGRLSIASMRADWHVTGGGLRLQSLMSLIMPNYYHIFTPFDPSQYKLPINFTFLYVYCGRFHWLLLCVRVSAPGSAPENAIPIHDHFRCLDAGR